MSVTTSADQVQEFLQQALEREGRNWARHGHQGLMEIRSSHFKSSSSLGRIRPHLNSHFKSATTPGEPDWVHATLLQVFFVARMVF